MAEKKVIELEIKSNLGDAEKSLGTLKQQLKAAKAEVLALSDEFGVTSQQAIKAAEKAGLLGHEIAQANKLVKAFNPSKTLNSTTTALGATSEGFESVGSAMKIVGLESKGLEKAVENVGLAMQITSGVTTIQESATAFRTLSATLKSYAIVQKAITAGQWLWNAAMAANPIGLLVAGVAALVAGGVALTNYFMSNAEAAKINTASINANKTALNNQSKTADSASKSLQTNSDYQLAMAKASGASTDAIRKLELKLIDEKIAFANSSREIAKNTYHKNLNALASLKASDADEEQIKLQEEITQKSLEEFGKQTKNLNDANAEKGNIIRKQNVEIRQEQTNHNKEIRDKNKEALTKLKEDAIAAAKELAAEKKKNDEEIAKVYRDKQITEEYAINDIIDAAKKANLDAGKSANQLAVEAEAAKYKENYDLAVKYGQDTIELDKQHKAFIQKQDDDYAVWEYEQAAKEVDDAIANQKRKYEALSLVTQGGMNLLAALQDAGIAKSKAGQMAMKALTLVQIGIDTASAFSNAVPMAIKAGAEAAKLAGPGAPIAGPLATAASYLSSATMIASNIAKAKKLLSSGGSATPASGGGGGGGAAPTPAAPSFNVVGASATNQLAQTIGNQQQQPIKAYVVSNDVTTAQSLDRNIISSASIG